MGEFVRLEVEDGVGTIRIDRPKMNALNAQVQEAEKRKGKGTLKDLIYGRDTWTVK